MIRTALEQNFNICDSDECLIRIQAQHLAYGFVPFIRYYTDEDGSLLSIMDGVGILYSPTITEEWQVFIEMNPDIQTLHCSAQNAKILKKTGQWQGGVGEVMIYRGESQKIDPDIMTKPNLMDVHCFLKENFPSVSPLNGWYPDVSHRIRHHRCHIATILQNNNVISSAMTVAETDSAAILGQIATSPEFRRQGLASKCIKSLVGTCKAKTLYMLPLNKKAQKLYETLGFEAVGQWSELERIQQ